MSREIDFVLETPQMPLMDHVRARSPFNKDQKSPKDGGHPDKVFKNVVESSIRNGSSADEAFEIGTGFKDWVIRKGGTYNEETGEVYIPKDDDS